MPRISPCCVVVVNIAAFDDDFAALGLERLGEPEVENLDPALGRDLDVRRLEIAMDDAALVRRFERLRDLLEDRQRLARRHRPAVDPLRQRLAGHELHLEESVESPTSSSPCSVAMLGWLSEASTRASRSNRLLYSGIVRRELVQDLDGDLTAQPDVLGAIHLAHASGAEGSQDPVRTDGAAWGEPQRLL